MNAKRVNLAQLLLALLLIQAVLVETNVSSSNLIGSAIIATLNGEPEPQYRRGIERDIAPQNVAARQMQFLG